MGPLFTRPKPVDAFTYQGHEVIIAQAIRGAICCEKPNLPRRKYCSACGAELKHEEIFLCIIDGNVHDNADDGDCKDPEEARELAKVIIEGKVEGNDPDDEDGEKDTERPPPPSEHTAGLPPPEASGQEPNIPNNLQHQIIKLSWPQRLVRIVHTHPKK
jgi:hypothetical protein